MTLQLQSHRASAVQIDVRPAVYLLKGSGNVTDRSAMGNAKTERRKRWKRRRKERELAKADIECAHMWSAFFSPICGTWCNFCSFHFELGTVLFGCEVCAINICVECDGIIKFSRNRPTLRDCVLTNPHVGDPAQRVYKTFRRVEPLDGDGDSDTWSSWCASP